MDSDNRTPSPYHAAGPKARYFKAIVQMAIAAVAVPAIVCWIVVKAWQGLPIAELSDGLFSSIGFALGAAAVVELAYTLYTDGPDEALNPLMLGLSAAMLIQLGRVTTFKTGEAVAALLYAAALAGLFAARKFLANVQEPEDWSLVAWWRGRANAKLLQRQMDAGGPQAKVGED